ncbi:MAG: hypothetical protein EKK53_23220 [Burkholderiales bacterium]|nr:MAG: hypothetical protein EKK53_23220 [Burkholderiales bacterium]
MRWALVGLAFVATQAVLAAPNVSALLTDRAAMEQLISAVSLDVMTEASVDACSDMGAPSAAAARAAWVAWRERHQIAPLRMVLISMKQRNGSSLPPWERLTEPMRQRVLNEPVPDKVCAALAQDLQGPAMDVGAQFPQARAVAQGLLQIQLAFKPTLPDVMPGTPRGQVLLPSQIPALVKQHGRWSAIGDDAARQRLGWVYVKGRVERYGMDGDRYRLVQEQGDRRAAQTVALDVSAEPWLGREVVLRGLFSSLDEAYTSLAAAALVSDASGLSPSLLPQVPLARKEVLLQRVMTAPGRGLAEKDLAAIVQHGEADNGNGTRWQDDVRFLLRDGTVYRRSEMPPDQLDVAASRQLEPQQWGRWRRNGTRVEVQDADDEGRPGDRWQPVPHRAVKPWPAGTRLEGSFSRASFTGSLALGGRSSSETFRFLPNGRFERSFSATSSTGTLAATLNNTVIAGSSHADGQGGSAVGGGTVGNGPAGGGGGTVGAISSRRQDDGASRRGRYQFSGFALVLDYDDGRQERLLSFPVDDDRQTVFVGHGSLTRDPPN